MKLEHLLQAYKVNNIKVESTTSTNNTGTIKFNSGISAAYLLDKEEIVVAMKMFYNGLPQTEIDTKKLIDYTIKVINIMQNTIMLLANIPQKESNMILQQLGLFDDTFKRGKKISHLDHEYKVELVDNLICLTINEIEKR